MTPRTLYVATSNPGKLRDFATAAASIGSHWHIAPLPNLAQIAPPEETGVTFVENATAKALYYAAFAPGCIVLADDSGLAIDALHGAPGVYSARYADQCAFSGAPALSTDERNNACLLQQLAPHPTNRTAHYLSVLAAARDTSLLATATGTVTGTILNDPRGTSGFGYDPLFLLPQLQKTMAELDAETRLQLSHRGAALRQLLPQLAHSV
jgi:XTP/dITP diphosphohydrolase